MPGFFPRGISLTRTHGPTPCSGFVLLITLVLGACGGPAGGRSHVRQRVIEVKGRQGIAPAGTRYQVSGSQALYVPAKDVALLASNEDPSAALEEPANPIGDISACEGEVEGLEFKEEAGEVRILANQGQRIVLGMPEGLHPDYSRAIHDVHVYALSQRGRRTHGV